MSLWWYCFARPSADRGPGDRLDDVALEKEVDDEHRQSGEYRLRITLVQEGVRWFDEVPGSAAAHDILLRVP